MMNAMTHMSPQEMAERVRMYHEAMEPHIKAASHLLGYSPQTLLSQDGTIQRITSPQEKQVIETLQEISRLQMKRLGLKSPEP